MAATQLGLYNQALQRLGTRLLSSTSETSAEAEALNAVYEDTRLFVLEQYPWSFSRTVVQLAQNVSTPTTVWTYFYDLPAGVVRILRLSDGVANYEWGTGPSVPYERQAGDLIASDAEALYLYYVADVTDVAKMTPAFRSTLAWRLAFEVCYRLVESTTRADWCERKYFQELEIAKSQDSQMSRARALPESSWLRARRAGVTSGDC